MPTLEDYLREINSDYEALKTEIAGAFNRGDLKEIVKENVNCTPMHTGTMTTYSVTTPGEEIIAELQNAEFEAGCFVILYPKSAADLEKLSAYCLGITASGHTFYFRFNTTHVAAGATINVDYQIYKGTNQALKAFVEIGGVNSLWQ